MIVAILIVLYIAFFQTKGINLHPSCQAAAIIQAFRDIRDFQKLSTTNNTGFRTIFEDMSHIIPLYDAFKPNDISHQYMDYDLSIIFFSRNHFIICAVHSRNKKNRYGSRMRYPSYWMSSINGIIMVSYQKWEIGNLEKYENAPPSFTPVFDTE